MEEQIAIENKYINELVKLEPVFEKAGKLACELQEKSISQMKYNSGFIEADIVTNADLEVQEMILQEAVKTKLVDCILLAEEDTPSVNKFTGSQKLYLTLDPINGTSLYAKGRPYFNLIAGLHNDRDVLYSYLSCPKVSWSMSIVRDKITTKGQPPRINLAAPADKAIIYSYGNPKKFAPDLHKYFENLGYEAVAKKSLTDESGSTTLFCSEQVAGFYAENLCVEDALTALHYAQAKKYQIKTSQDFDITKIIETSHGRIHPGCYFAVRPID